MKISIKHIDNTFNYGSCMMAITLINKLNRSFNNVEFYVDSVSDKDIERIKLETGVENIYRDNIESSSNLIIKCINKIKRIKLNKFIDKIENVVVIGGDDISEYYTLERLEKELNRLSKESKYKNIILVGQTMGPFTGRRIEMAKECLKDTKIFTRDDKNFEYLQSINFTNINKGRDLAFYDLPIQNNVNYILDKYKLQNISYITIVLSGLTECYTKNTNEYIKNQVDIIKNIINNPKLLSKKIVLLPHVLLPEHVDDRIIIKKVSEMLSEDDRKRIIFINDSMLASEARVILGNGEFTITGRMHAAVSTLYMRKPAISLSYSVKYAGVIGEGLDLNELVIESADEELWASGKISDLVDEKINYVLENYDRLIKKIDINVTETTKIVERELEDVVRQININK